MYNDKIKMICKNFNIDYSNCILFLTALEHKLDYSVIPEYTQKQICIAGLAKRDYMNRKVEITIPLYQNTDIEWQWLEQLNAMFIELNPARSSDNREIKDKMITFMHKNMVTQSQVYDAVIYYLQSVDPQYVQTFSNFIEKDGKSNLLNVIRGVSQFNFA